MRKLVIVLIAALATVASSHAEVYPSRPIVTYLRGASGAGKYPRHGFPSWTVTEARVCSQSKRISHVLPFRTKEIVKFSSVDGSFDVVTGTRTMSEASPG